MTRLSFKRHRYPGHVLRYAVWLYFGFMRRFRDVEETLARRGIDVSYESIRCWVNKFGPQIAANLRRRQQRPSERLHLDEMVCNIGGARVFLWRAVDDDGGVMDFVVQMRRDTRAALEVLKCLLKTRASGLSAS